MHILQQNASAGLPAMDVAKAVPHYQGLVLWPTVKHLISSFAVNSCHEFPIKQLANPISSPFPLEKSPAMHNVPFAAVIQESLLDIVWYGSPRNSIKNCKLILPWYL